MNDTLLLLVPIAAEHKAALLARFRVIDAPDAASRAAAIADHAAEIELVLTNGSVGFTAPRDRRLAAPEAAGRPGRRLREPGRGRSPRTRRGRCATALAPTTTAWPTTHWALLLAGVRALPQQGLALRAGAWRDALPLYPSFTGRRLGVVGLGGIGQKIARRAAAFGMIIGYHNRRPRADAGDAHYVDSAAGLAAWADDLVVATPGGTATKHIINAEVLAALGGGRAHRQHRARQHVWTRAPWWPR